ncbi:MAG: ferric reductase-like transmembrane domain-containing protein [bacterium]
MFKRFSRFSIISLVTSTSLAFLWLYTNLDFSSLNSDSKSFWDSFVYLTANITGYVAAMLFVWEMFFGVRYLVQLVTDDLPWVNKFHAFIGKYALLLALVHPVLEMIVYAQNVLWLFIPDLKSKFEFQVTYGRVAFILFLIIYLTSALLRSKIKYRPWLYIHYLSYPLMFLTFIHALDIGTYLNKYVELKALWFMMLGLYLVLIWFRLLMWSGVTKFKYKITDKAQKGKDIFLIVLKPEGKFLLPKVGQYFYLQLKDFGEAHPFTVMESDETTGTLIFGIKTLGSFTKKVSELEIGSIINVDGPYGVFTLEGQNTNPKVIIAGGIGITPFLDLVNKFKSPTTVFLHANRHLDEALARNALKSQLGNRYIDFVSQDSTTGESIINSRLKPKLISQILGSDNLIHYNYFICGSPRFIEGVKDMLNQLEIPLNNVYVEEFSF